MEREKNELTLEEKVAIYEDFLTTSSLDESINISHIPILSEDEELEFAQKIEDGESFYKNYLFVANLRYMRQVAHKLHHQTLSYHNFDKDDFFQEGAIGLMRAVDKFDYKMGYRFTTYATWWINQSITRAYKENGKAIKYPHELYNQYTRFRKVFNTLSIELDRKPTDKEIQDILGIEKEKLHQLQEIDKRNTLSLEQEISNNGEEIYLKDLIEDVNAVNPEENAVKSVFKSEIDNILQAFTKTEQLVIRNYTNKGIEKLSKELNIPKGKIRKIHVKSMRKLKPLLQEKGYDKI